MSLPDLSEAGFADHPEQACRCKARTAASTFFRAERVIAFIPSSTLEDHSQRSCRPQVQAAAVATGDCQGDLSHWPGGGRYWYRIKLNMIEWRPARYAGEVAFCRRR